MVIIIRPRDYIYISETKNETETETGLTIQRNNSETERLTIYQERTAVMEETCQKYGLYSSQNETNQYQTLKNSYTAPIQVGTTVRSILILKVILLPSIP